MNQRRVSLRMRDYNTKSKIKLRKYKEKLEPMTKLFKQDKQIIHILNKMYPYKIISNLRLFNPILYKQIGSCASIHNMSMKKYLKVLGFKIKRLTHGDMKILEKEILNIVNECVV